MNTKLKMTAESMTKEEAFAEVLEALKRRLPGYVKLIKENPCFAVLWSDESGVCPHKGTCGAAKMCSATWRAATLLHTPLAPRVLDRTPMRLAVLPDRAPPPVAVAAPRQKHAKITRPARRLRPVDRAVARFLSGLGAPAVLPAHWHPDKIEEQHKRCGRMVISRTAGFVSVLVDGVMRLRFWTDAAGRARIEVVDELVPALMTIVGAVEEIPEGSKKKSLPCVYRVTLVFCDDDVLPVIDEIAAAVIKIFNIGVADG